MESLRSLSINIIKVTYNINRRISNAIQLDIKNTPN